MSNSSLSATFINFHNGTTDAVRATATDQKLSFQGATASHKATLTNLDNPQNDDDASTKLYVDSKISSEINVWNNVESNCSIATGQIGCILERTCVSPRSLEI